MSIPYNLIKRDKLKIPEDTADFAISNRRHATLFVTDSVGSQHPVYIEVTTFYLRREGKNFISFSDPWLLPNDFKEDNPNLEIINEVSKRMKGFIIHVPSDFQIEKFSASASTLFIHGKNTINREDEL